MRTEDGRPPDQQVEEMDEFLRSKLEENRRNREIQRKAKRGVNAAYVKVLMQPDKYKKTEQEVICETADIYWGQHNFELIKPVTIEERDIIYSNP